MKEVIVKVPSFSADYPKAPIYVADLVRCKECRWASPNGKYGCMLKPFSKNDWQYHHLFSDDFCSYGERNSDEQ